MPSSVVDLLRIAQVDLTGKVQWGRQVACAGPGVYIISLSDNEARCSGNCDLAPICLTAVSRWFSLVTTLELDGKPRPPAKKVAERLSEFWLPDENILYIGMTTTSLKQRIQDFYCTELGKGAPHSGGQWLKTLAGLENLYIYFANCERPSEIENQLLDAFIGNVSRKSLLRLRDPERPFPFANLEHPKGVRKKHGIGKGRLVAT